MPAHLTTEGDELVAELLVARTVADVPLPCGDDLERAIALLVELHHVREGLRVADELAGLGEQLDDALLGAEDRLAGELGVGRFRLIRHDDLGGVCEHSSVGAENRAVGQVQFAPPDDVGHVAERADHRDARALVGLRQRVRNDGDLDVEQGGAHRRAEQRPIALVIGVRHQRDARREQLGAGRLDVDVAGAVGLVEGDPVIRRRLLPVFELGLRDRGAEVDVPQGGRHGLIGLPALEVAQERVLAGAHGVVGDRAVGLGPVDAQTERAPEGLEVLLVFDGELLAELDEVAAADRHLIGRATGLVVAALERRREIGVVRQGGIAPNSEVVLHAALGGQAVVIPPHRVEDGLAAHALEAHLHVGVGVAEDVPDVQASARGRRGSVHGVDPLAASRGGADTVEEVRALGIPPLRPLRFETFEGGLVGNERIGHGVSCAICAALCERA